MLRNFIQIALRSLIKQKVYSAINIVGFSVSICACLLILLYIQHETSYDKFFPKSERMYKMALERIYPDHRTFYAVIPHSFAYVMKKDFPEVVNTLLLNGPANRVNITYQASDTEIRSFEESYFMLGDTTFFDFFDIELVKGNKQTALRKPQTVVITEATAKRYFGDTDPLGKVLGGDVGEFTVTGVCKNLPENSHLRFDLMGSLDTNPGFRNEFFTSFTAHAYVLLKPGADYKALEAKFPKMVDTYAAAQIERERNISWSDYKKAGNGYRYFLQPLANIHLDPTNLESTITPSGNGDYVRILGYVALLILIIASINFMNLAIARSAERAREVGVRKVMGSPRAHLIYQFLTESVIVSLLATLLAIVLTYVLLPSFNQLAQKQLVLLMNTQAILLTTGFALVIGTLAGLYPAFILSAFNPVVVMKGNFSGSPRGNWMRNSLVVFQFVISIVLIVGTLVMGQQMQYMQSKDLGFNKDLVVYIERAFTLQDKTETFVDELRQTPGVVQAALTSSVVGKQGDFFGESFQSPGALEALTTKTMYIEDNFFETIGFELLEGRAFSKESNDSLSILVNESTARLLGGKNVVGMRLINNGNNFDGTQTERTFNIIGIVRDFHFQSLHDPITPLILFSNEYLTFNQYVAVKINAQDRATTLASLEASWTKFNPGAPYHFNFLDDEIASEYAEEKRSGQLFSMFSGLAISIACVGLFGLSAYTTSLRTKEIGVRKVHGASVTGVTILLSKEFTKLVLVAFVLAAPVGWWMMNNWLQSFAYRITLGAGSFLLAGGAALTIAWLTVSYQSIKAARADPIRSLKSE